MTKSEILYDIKNEEIDDGGTPKMVINVNFPPVLSKKLKENGEAVINLLQIASVVWNNQLTANPAKGFGHIIFFLKSERVEYDFRVHEVYFSPTLDLENINMTALISSTNNKELTRCMNDGVLSFYVSGKIIQKKNGDIESIVINKLSTKVDQTAYAKRYSVVKEREKLPKEFENDNVWKADAIRLDGVAKAWEDFQLKQKKRAEEIEKNAPIVEISTTSVPTESSSPVKVKSHFEVWRERFRAINKRVDNLIKP